MMRLSLFFEKVKILSEAHKNQYTLILTNLLLFTFYLSISIFVPYQADDFNFKINPLENSFSFELFSNIFDSLWYWYHWWTGRLFGMFFVHLFLIPEKIYFDIFNSFIQVILINTIFFIAKNRFPNSIIDSSFLLFINFLLFFGFYGYCGAVTNLTFSINTTWTHTFTLVYYAFFVSKWKINHSLKDKFLFFVFGILSGCGLEQVFIAQLSFFAILFFSKYLGKIQHLPNYFFPSLFGVITGGLILMLSPGNFSRASYGESNVSLNFDKVIFFLKYEINWFIKDIYPFWLVAVPLIIVYVLKLRIAPHITLKSKLILLVGFLSSISLAFSPQYHRGTNIFFYYCILIFLITSINFDKKTYQLPRKKIFLCQILLTLGLLAYIIPYQLRIHEYSVYLEEEILKQKAEQKEVIVVDQIEIKTNRLISYNPLFDDPKSDRNTMAAKYYSVDSIKSLNKK